MLQLAYLLMCFRFLVVSIFDYFKSRRCIGAVVTTRNRRNKQQTVRRKVLRRSEGEWSKIQEQTPGEAQGEECKGGELSFLQGPGKEGVPNILLFYFGISCLGVLEWDISSLTVSTLE